MSWEEVGLWSKDEPVGWGIGCLIWLVSVGSSFLFMRMAFLWIDKRDPWDSRLVLDMEYVFYGKFHSWGAVTFIVLHSFLLYVAVRLLVGGRIYHAIPAATLGGSYLALLLFPSSIGYDYHEAEYHFKKKFWYAAIPLGLLTVSGEVFVGFCLFFLIWYCVVYFLRKFLCGNFYVNSRDPEWLTWEKVYLSLVHYSSPDDVFRRSQWLSSFPYWFGTSFLIHLAVSGSSGGLIVLPVFRQWLWELSVLIGGIGGSGYGISSFLRRSTGSSEPRPVMALWLGWVLAWGILLTGLAVGTGNLIVG